MKVSSTAAAETTYVDKDVAPGKTYFYTATAINSTNNQSIYSDEVAATIPMQ